VDYVGSSAICKKMRSESVAVFHKILSGRGRFSSNGAKPSGNDWPMRVEKSLVGC
jgi:hypothetical protein